MDSFFEENLRLFDGIFFKKIIRFPTFRITLDAIGPSYFDFILPSSPEKEFDWDQAGALIKKYRKKGVVLHYYLSNNFQKDYIDKLTKTNKYKIESEAYMVGEIKKPFNLSGNFKLEAMTRDNIENFISIAETCFPQYSNNRPYAEHICQLEEINNQREKKCRNVFLQVNGARVAIGCLVYSKKMNLAYFHNFATLPKYRRKGYFFLLKKALINDCLKEGITRFYSINAVNSPAHKANLSLGFEQHDVYSFFGPK